MFRTPVPEKISAHVHVSCQTGLARPDSIMNLNRQPISEQHRRSQETIWTSDDFWAASSLPDHESIPRWGVFLMLRLAHPGEGHALHQLVGTLGNLSSDSWHWQLSSQHPEVAAPKCSNKKPGKNTKRAIASLPSLAVMLPAPCPWREPASNSVWC